MPIPCNLQKNFCLDLSSVNSQENTKSSRIPEIVSTPLVQGSQLVTRQLQQVCGRKYASKFIQLPSSRPSGKGKRWFILVLQRLMLSQNVLCDYSLGTTVRRKGPAAQGLPVINCPLDKQICIACALCLALVAHFPLFPSQYPLN